jgi:hypothetical protein
VSETQPAAAFAAFREAVLDDAGLLREMRPPQERDAYVAHVVAAGARCGFGFDEASVRAALRDGQERWLMMSADVV